MLNNIFYINLSHRVDRRQKVENELEKMGWSNYERFNAIKLKDPRVGCSISHLKVIKIAKERNLDYVVVLEDDVEFTQPGDLNVKLDAFSRMNIDYDVLLLAGNLRPPVTHIKDFVFRAQKSFAGTAYVVKKHYYDILIKNIESGIRGLMNDSNSHPVNAFDTHWFILQQKDKWLIFLPRTVKQSIDYSDIEKKNVDYSRLMLD